MYNLKYKGPKEDSKIWLLAFFFTRKDIRGDILNRRRYNGTIAALIFIMVLMSVRDNLANPGNWIYDKLVILPGIILGLSFHEFAHGFASYKLGDPTPKAQGRVTLNPMAHIDPIGFVALLLCGFGWGKPVQIDTRYYKKPRRDEIIVGFAGVTMNLIIAVIFMLIFKLIFVISPTFLLSNLGGVVVDVIKNVIVINLVLMVFNLLPVPPLDGFGIITNIFDLTKYDWYYKLYNNGFLILTVLILFNVTSFILGPAVSGIYSFLANIIL